MIKHLQFLETIVNFISFSLVAGQYRFYCCNVLKIRNVMCINA